MPYEWNGQTLSAAGQLVNTVTDANGCEYDEVLNLTVNAGTPADLTDRTICADELPFDWNGQTITSAGQYTNDVTDNNGCSFNEVLNISVHTIELTGNQTSSECNTDTGVQNGEITISVTGGEGNYTYAWSGTGSGLEPEAANQTELSAGTYTVIVTDASGCTATGSWVLTEPSTITISGQTTSLVCSASNGPGSGAINVTVSGGQGNSESDYNYTWATIGGSGLVPSAGDQSGLASGRYDLTVTDASGCSATASWDLAEPDILSVLASAVDLTCGASSGAPDGEISLSVIGGTPGYTYLWSSENGAGLDVNAKDQSGLTAGTYTLIVTDASGCTQMESYVLLEPQTTTPDEITDLTICEEELPYSWNGQSLTTGGQYFNPATDNNGCTYQEVLNLAVNAETAAEVTDLTICEAELPYAWNGQTLSAAGQLINTVTDANGCEYDEVLNLTVNAGTPADVTDLTVCEAELPYEWNAQTLSAAGQLVNTVTDLSLIHI